MTKKRPRLQPAQRPGGEEEKVQAIVCLGTDNKKIHEAFSDIVPMIINTKQLSTPCVPPSWRIKGDGIAGAWPAPASTCLKLRRPGQLVQESQKEL